MSHTTLLHSNGKVFAFNRGEVQVRMEATDYPAFQKIWVKLSG